MQPWYDIAKTKNNNKNNNNNNINNNKNNDYNNKNHDNNNIKVFFEGIFIIIILRYIKLFLRVTYAKQSQPQLSYLFHRNHYLYFQPKIKQETQSEAETYHKTKQSLRTIVKTSTAKYDLM